MLFSQLPVLLFTAMMLPSFAEAGIFYKNSPVKMLDAKSFKKVMRENVRCAVVGSVFSLESSLANVCLGGGGIANERRGVCRALVWGAYLYCVRECSLADTIRPLALQESSTGIREGRQVFQFPGAVVCD